MMPEKNAPTNIQQEIITFFRNYGIWICAVIALIFLITLWGNRFIVIHTSKDGSFYLLNRYTGEITWCIGGVKYETEWRE